MGGKKRNMPRCWVISRSPSVASKRNFSTYSWCEWVVYQSTPEIMLTRNMCRMRIPQGSQVYQ